MTVFTGLV